jgi:cysteine-rich repeat protein
VRYSYTTSDSSISRNQPGNHWVIAYLDTTSSGDRFTLRNREVGQHLCAIDAYRFELRDEPCAWYFMGPLGTAACTSEWPYVCGNGMIEAGERCDDGNTRDGDDCPATCTF